jgi:uncharacterized protein
LGRILLLIVIGFLIYLLFRGFMRSQAKRDATRTPSQEPEDMIACARCGVNLPRSSAREEAGKWVCQGNPNCR